MPMIIPGVIAVSERRAKEHGGHILTVMEPAQANDGYLHGWGITCVDCDTLLADALSQDTLPCGCRTKHEHDEGLRLQAETRRQVRIPASTCVGCYVGDDGPTMHSCYIHR